MSKQRFLDAQGKEVPLDYFLYGCLEHERTQESMEASGAEKIEWPALTDQQEGALTGEVSEKKLRELLYSMGAWYKENYPVLGDSKPLDHEQFLEIVAPLCAFNRDITKVYRLRCEEDIPSFDASVGNNRIWDDITECVEALFSGYAHLVIRFIQWSHATDKEELEDLSSRPPVGRFAPKFNRSGGGTSKGNSRGPDRGGSRHGGGDRGSGRQGRFAGNARQDRGNVRGNDRGHDRGNSRGNHRGDRNDRGNARHGGRRNSREAPRGGTGKDSARLEEAAMMEVYRAFKSLEKNADVDEVTLKPTNSFYRRLQHQKAVESGYHSFSVGEGHDRAVKITRKLDD